MAESAHFVVYCRCYPAFSFKVPMLLSLRRQKAETEEEKKFVTGIVHFQHGCLDTKMQGFSEDEALLIHANIKARNSRPAYGVDIIEAGMQITGRVVDGRYPCPQCKEGFDSAEGLSNHLIASHSGNQKARMRAA
jgi:hypothetical protein